MAKPINSLLIVSHVTHYQHDHQVYAYGPYAREIDIWADLFPQVTIAAPLRMEKPPSDCLPFASVNIDMFPQLERGGDTWWEKMFQLISLPRMLLRLSSAMQNVDAIHVRCPGNLGLLGLILAPLFAPYRVAKYAGQWNGYPDEPLSNRLQRLILASTWWKSPVLVYGHWPNQPKIIKPFFTSMMSDPQVHQALAIARTKAQAHSPVRLLFSGRLVPVKNVEVVIDAVKLLDNHGLNVKLKIIGDGPSRQELEARVRLLSLEEKIDFEGSFPYEQSLRWNEWADCLLLPSKHSEGWPKVVAEAMCYGVVPIVVDHGQLIEMVKDRGFLLANGTPHEFAEAIMQVVALGGEARKIRWQAAEWAGNYSLSSMRNELRSLLSHEWAIPESIFATGGQT
jgi:glycosyltransferase involved in cell wall biosynthesis